MAGRKGKATIKDVAKAAGVGLGTVSRVLNNRPHVNEASRERVFRAIEQLQYRPDLVARSMRAGASKTLAFVVRDFTGATLSTLADAVQAEADGPGFSLYVASSYHDPRREIALLQSFKARRVDGIVMATSSETDAQLQAEIVSIGVPVVLLDREAPAGLDSVLIEHAHGVMLAMDYLAGLGHTRIAMVTGEPDVFPTRERIRGYLEGLKKAGLSRSLKLCRYGSYSSEDAYRHAKALLTGKKPPTAVIAGGTALLPGILRAARELDLRIPQDLSIIGGADSDLARYMAPPVTVVRWDHEGFGRVAGQFLINRLRDPSLPRQCQRFMTELVIRASCGPPPSD